MAHVGQKLALGDVGHLSPDRHLIGSDRSFLKLAVGIEERSFGVLLCRDIPVCAEHAQSGSRGSAFYCGYGSDVMSASVRPKNTKLGVKILFSAERHLDFRIRPHDIILVDSGLPSLIRAAELVARDSVEAKHMVIPDEAIVDNVIVPYSHSTCFRGKGQAFGSLGLSLLGAFAGGDVLGNPQKSGNLSVGIFKRRDREQHGNASPIFADIGPFLFIGKSSARLHNKHFKAALKRFTIASLPEVWNDTPTAADDFLAACPLGVEGNPSALLLVKSMPFSSVNARGMAIIEVICRWVSEFSDLDRRAEGLFDPRGLVPFQDFDRMLGLACKVQTMFQLVSSVIVFRPADGCEATRSQLVSSVAGSIRIGDILSSMDCPTQHVLLFLPLTGRRGAEICVERFKISTQTSSSGQISIRGEIFCTDELADAAALRLALNSALGRP